MFSRIELSLNDMIDARNTKYLDHLWNALFTRDAGTRGMEGKVISQPVGEQIGQMFFDLKF